MPSNSLTSLATSVLRFGAKGDGITDDTATIIAAIAAGSVYFPPLTYLVSGQISVPSNRLVKLSPGATLLRKAGTGQQNAATLTNANFFVNSDTINGNSNITIDGGIYDGNQANQTPLTFPGTGQYCGGVGMRFLNVTGLVMRDLVFQNNISYQIQIGNVTQFELRGIQFIFSGTGLHQDGVHVNGPASSGLIRDIWSTGGNDALIALNADDDTFGLMSTGDIKNVLVENVTCTGLNVAPYIGSAVMLLNSTHNIYDVTLRNFRGLGYQATGAVGLIALEGSPSGIIDRLIIEGFDLGTPRLNDAFCQCSLNLGNVSFINNRWSPGNGSADVTVTAQNFFRQTGGTITNLFFSGNQIIGHNVNTTPAFWFSGTVTNVSISDTVFTSTAPQGGALVTIDGAVTNLIINGLVGTNLAAVLSGAPSGILIKTSICTNPAVS